MCGIYLFYVVVNVRNDKCDLLMYLLRQTTDWMKIRPGMEGKRKMIYEEKKDEKFFAVVCSCQIRNTHTYGSQKIFSESIYEVFTFRCCFLSFFFFFITIKRACLWYYVRLQMRISLDGFAVGSGKSKREIILFSVFLRSVFFLLLLLLLCIMCCVFFLLSFYFSFHFWG